MKGKELGWGMGGRRKGKAGIKKDGWGEVREGREGLGKGGEDWEEKTVSEWRWNGKGWREERVEIMSDGWKETCRVEMMRVMRRKCEGNGKGESCL